MVVFIALNIKSCFINIEHNEHKHRRTHMKTTIFFLPFALAAFGCNNPDDSAMMTNPSEQAFTIYPADNQTDVSTSGAVTLTFSKKVDRIVVEQNFHLVNEMALLDSMCPQQGMMPRHGTMNTAMNDSMMMNHLDSVHHSKGSFTWRSDSLQCTFKPDSLMMPGTQYMIHLNSPMVQMMEERMGNMGMMGRQEMNGMKDMMFHFTTKNSGSGGNGHNGHH